MQAIGHVSTQTELDRRVSERLLRSGRDLALLSFDPWKPGLYLGTSRVDEGESDGEEDGKGKRRTMQESHAARSVIFDNVERTRASRCHLRLLGRARLSPEAGPQHPLPYERDKGVPNKREGGALSTSMIEDRQHFWREASSECTRVKADKAFEQRAKH